MSIWAIQIGLGELFIVFFKGGNMKLGKDVGSRVDLRGVVGRNRSEYDQNTLHMCVKFSNMSKIYLKEK